MNKQAILKYIVLFLYFSANVLLLALFAARTNFAAVNIETISSSLAYWVFIILVTLMLAYYAIFRLRIELNRPILRYVLIFMLILTFSMPLFSADIGSYLISSRNFVLYHTNPYVTPLNYFNKDIWVNYMGSIWWMSYPSIYGPVSLFLSALVVFLTHSSIYLSLIAYKILVLISILFSIHLFRKLDSSHKKSSTLLLIMNPILLLNILLDGHNDAFVLLSLMAFLYFLEQKQVGKSFIALLGGIFVKFTSIILLPSLFIINRKIDWIKIISTVALVSIIFLLFLFYARLNLHTFLSNNSLLVNKRCIYACTPIVFLFNIIFKNYANHLRLILFALIYIAMIFRYLYLKYNLYKFIFWAFVALFFVGSMAFLPWYAICPIAVGLLVPDKKYKYFVIALTAYSLLFYFGI